jgi:hypothetical protein
LFYLLFFYIHFIPFSSYPKLSSSFISYSYILFLLRCAEPHSWVTFCGGRRVVRQKVVWRILLLSPSYLVTANLRGHYVEITNHLRSVHSLKNCLRDMVTYMGDCRRDFGLDDWGYCALCIHNSELQAVQRYRGSTHFPVRRCTGSRVLSLH